jgi:protein-disulfide isomerase/uncharacterized membrane protein
VGGRRLERELGGANASDQPGEELPVESSRPYSRRAPILPFECFVPEPVPTTLHGAPRAIPAWAYAFGLVAIVVALVASGALVAQHLFDVKLPGCSAGGQGGMSGTSIMGGGSAPASACASLEAHPMGSLGGMKLGIEAKLAGNPVPKITLDQAFWPVSFLGAAFFAAALAGWLVIAVNGRRVPGAVRWVVRVGALASLGYMIVILVEKKYCQYCITSHIANLMLLASVEIGMMMSVEGRAGRRGAGAWRPVLAGLAAFGTVSAAMGFKEGEKREATRAAAEAEFKRTEQELKEKIAADQKKAEALAAAAEQDPWPIGLRARWTLGPENAEVRVIIMSSYECPDCKRVEQEAFQMMEKYPGKMSLGAMHFPLNPDCNKFVSKGAPPPHPNSCWAARAAETAGMLSGPDGFWKMHKWLFEKNGKFTNEEIRAGVKSLGFDETTFMTLMQGAGVNGPIEKDCEVGHKLGLYFTPLVFVNGVEMRGWNVPGTLVRTVETVMAQNPKAMSPSVDKPVLAAQKYIDDWNAMPVRAMPQERAGRSVGPADAQVQVVIFGDYAEPNSQKAWDLISTIAKDPARSTRVVYRHYPGDQTCNKSLPKTFFANGCLAAQAAEAAGIVHGDDGFWKMHAWLFAHPDKTKLSVNEIKRGANSLGLDSGKIEALIAKPETENPVALDIGAGQSVGIQQIPQIFVNGKFVQRWERENDNVMDRVVTDAIRQKTP